MNLPCNIDFIVLSGAIGLAIGLWIGKMLEWKK